MLFDIKMKEEFLLLMILTFLMYFQHGLKFREITQISSRYIKKNLVLS